LLASVASSSAGRDEHAASAEEADERPAERDPQRCRHDERNERPGPVEVALPVHVARELGASAQLLGAYWTSFALGALAATFVTGALRTGNVRGITIAMVAGWGACLLPFSFAPVPVTLVCFAAGGLIYEATGSEGAVREDEDGRRPAPEEPAKRDAADDPGQRVRRHRQAHVGAGVAGWRDRQREPGDGDDAAPVAQRRDGQAGKQAACPGVPQQTAISG
jgi:hypothetical protein